MKKTKVVKLLAVLIAMVMVMGVIACGTNDAAPAEDVAVADETPDVDEDEPAVDVPEVGDDVVTIAVSIRSMSNEYHMQYVAGAEAFVATLPEGSAVVQILACEADDARQINDIQSLVTTNENVVLLVDPNNAPNIMAIAEAAEEAGVYWASFWNKPDGVTPLQFNYWVHHQALCGETQGYMIARTMFEALDPPGEGNIVVMQGMLANTANVDRVRGLERALEAFPGINVLENQTANWDTNEGMVLMETWLAAHDDIVGVWAASDGMSIGAIQALIAHGLDGQVLVTGVDGASAAIEAIQDGTMLVTYVNNGWLQGFYAAAWVWAAHTGQINVSELTELERMFTTPGVLLTRDNMDYYLERFVHNTPVFDPDDLHYPIVGPLGGQ